MSTSGTPAFAALGLSAPLLRTLSSLGHRQPTPVQAAAIPAILRGEDVQACAPTGSGKTAAFALPLLERLAARLPQPPQQGDAPLSRLRRVVEARRPRPVRALVLVPTRELAAQVAEAVARYGAGLPARPVTCVCIGGVSINPQMLALRGGADLVVATPGRLLELVEKNALKLGTVETLVVDEADRLLSLGFADELARVLALLPLLRQNLLFSATFPPAVSALCKGLLRAPARIELGGAGTSGPAVIRQRAIAVDTGQRTSLLRHLLKAEGWRQVLVFVASQHGADHVALKLNRAGVSALPLHGDLSQGARTQALSEFKAGRVHVLVATDLASRGLDIALLPVVVNYDLPRSPTDYLHRIGRTGRAGEPGVAVSFVTAEVEAHFRLIERRHGLDLSRERVPGFEPAAVVAPPLDPHGGVKGKRKSKKDKLREAAAGKAPPERSGE